MMAINPEYLAKFQELYARKNSIEMQLLRPDLTTEQENAINAEIVAMQAAIDSYDLSVKEFEGLKTEDIIDHTTGFVTVV